MATHLPYNDSVFFFRLLTLIVDGGTEILRNIFNYRLNNQPLVTFLTNETKTIMRLQVKKTITKRQYAKLFPPGGQNPDSEDFDMTLLLCLLKNIPSLGLNMMYPWHIFPTQIDTSIEADLIRLRTYRNEFAHTTSTHCLDKPTYDLQWNKVEQCLLRLNSGPHSDPNLQATIDSFKNSPLDPANEQKRESLSNIIKEGNIIYTRKNIVDVTEDVDVVTGDVELQEVLIRTYQSDHSEMKIYCRYGEDTENLIPVLKAQVRCLQLVDGSLGSWTGSLFEKLKSLHKLEVIDIRWFTMSHLELRLLYDFISRKVDMRQIELLDLNCSDHGMSSCFNHEESPCSGLSLDLSSHSQLRGLTLDRIPLSELKINMTSLGLCLLYSLSLSSCVFTRRTFDRVNSGLNKSDVWLSVVTIPASVLNDLVTVIQNLPQTVCVGIERCDIKPENEWKLLKDDIRTTQNFSVLEEEEGLWPGFVFETIKHRN